jgi:sulfopropanediol 3-dehydrogenase
MHLTARDRSRITGSFDVVREPARPDVAAQSDPAVIETVSTMLQAIELDGLAAVRRYAEKLDGWTGGDDFEISDREVAELTASLPADLKEALDAGAERAHRFARMQRERLIDFEDEVVPGVVCGQKYIPINNVGAYLPAGRFPLLASAFMTVGVARAAGVPNIVSTTPPSLRGRPHPAVLYAAKASGAERIFALGGVQALAAMAFGLLDGLPADMIVGAGNAFVAEAKRQLYGKVGIDVLAGPSEVAVIAEEGASAEMVAADLLAQAEHGPSSPACLVTTSAKLAAEVEIEIERQLAGLATRDIAGPAWRDWGSIYVASSPKIAIEIMDLLAPEHLEILAEDTDFYLDNLHNYGSLFLGNWSTVAYADKGMSGTNHVLPTARGARYTGGLSVSRFLKQVTYQRATREATKAQAEYVVTIADFEGMPGHRDSAQLRLDLISTDHSSGGAVSAPSGSP